MIVDKDLLDNDNLAVQTSVTSDAYIGQTWTASASGQLVEVRVIGGCGPAWGDDELSVMRMEGVSGNGWPNTFGVLASGQILTKEGRNGDEALITYSIPGGLRVAAGDELAAVFPTAAKCHLATTTASGAIGLWTAHDNGYWEPVSDASLRFMVLLRP